jgi:hypothetical protein
MILWHLGIGAALVYVTLGRRRIDYRFILLGAIAPDLVDGLLGLITFDGPSGRWIAHSLLTPVAIAIVIVVIFKGERRLSVFGLAVGWLTHLVADGMWQAPRTFLWPLFGTEFATRPPEPYSIDLLANPLAHAATWVAELVGLGLLVWFWIAFDLGDPARRRLFIHDGRLRA